MSQPPNQPFGPALPRVSPTRASPRDTRQPYPAPAPASRATPGPPSTRASRIRTCRPRCRRAIPPQPAYGRLPTSSLPTRPRQPGYAQPGYPQQDYAQPGYPQSGPPMGGYPLPPKKKSRALPITLVSIAVVLVLCVGGSTASTWPAATPPTTSPTPSTTTPPTRGSTTTEPTDDRPPRRRRGHHGRRAQDPGRPPQADRPAVRGRGQAAEEGLADVPSATETVGALYGTPAKQDIVIVAAAAAPVDDPKKELDGTFLGAGIGGLKITGITDRQPGRTGRLRQVRQGRGRRCPADHVRLGGRGQRRLGDLVLQDDDKRQGRIPQAQGTGREVKLTRRAAASHVRLANDTNTTRSRAFRP